MVLRTIRNREIAGSIPALGFQNFSLLQLHREIRHKSELVARWFSLFAPSLRPETGVQNLCPHSQGLPEPLLPANYSKSRFQFFLEYVSLPSPQV
jgi:hypothetical protein